MNKTQRKCLETSVWHKDTRLPPGLHQQCHHLVVHIQRTAEALTATIPRSEESSYAVIYPVSAMIT